MADYVSLTDQRQITITLPPITRQRADAEVLGLLDDKIEGNRLTRAALENAARAIFRAWFIDFEPVKVKAVGASFCASMPPNLFDVLTSKFIETEIGRVPADWTLRPLGEIADSTKGLSYKGAGLVKEAEFTDGTMPFHNLNSIYEGGGYKTEGIKFYAGEYKPRHILHAGDLIVANTEQGFEYRLIGFPAIVPSRFGNKGLFSHHIFRIIPRPGFGIGRYFVYHALMAGRIREEVCGCTNGTTVNMLSVDGLQRPLVCVPPKSIGEAFEKMASAMHKLQEALEEESVKLAELRDYLLPKLLSCEVGVKMREEAHV